jgi:hypothetical protein
MSQHEIQPESLDASTLAGVHGGLPVGKLWKAAKETYGKVAPYVKEAAKKVGPFILPAHRAHNIYERATDDK